MTIVTIFAWGVVGIWTAAVLVDNGMREAKLRHWRLEHPGWFAAAWGYAIVLTMAEFHVRLIWALLVMFLAAFALLAFTIWWLATKRGF